MPLTNKHNLSLPLAVALAYDNYDFIKGDKYFSATQLLKGTKKLVLSKRAAKQGLLVPMDVSEKQATVVGTAFHDRAENLILNGQYREVLMKSLGYDSDFVDSIVVNPTEPLKPHQNPIYIEQRVIKELNGFQIGGKYDYIWQGVVSDYKTTSTFAFKDPKKHQEWMMQGSINRWLNQDIVTEDYTNIDILFKDFSAKVAEKGNPDYPPHSPYTMKLPLASIEDTEKFLIAKCREIERYESMSEDAMHPCSKEDLWMGASVFKYYASGKIGTRASKNFSDAHEAHLFMQDKPNGLLVEVKGEPKACNYCNGRPVCNQYKNMVIEGLIK